MCFRSIDSILEADVLCFAFVATDVLSHESTELYCSLKAEGELVPFHPLMEWHELASYNRIAARWRKADSDLVSSMN